MTARLIKICGLNDAAGVDAAVRAGATHLAFNFFPKSPRYVTPAAAAELARAVPPHVTRVALLVDPDDALLAEAAQSIAADIVQLHGRETPDRIVAARRNGFRLWKALPVQTRADVDAAHLYGAAEAILFDAKAPPGATRPGGLGHVFDWTLLDGLALKTPWILSGGLNPANVGDAIRLTGTRAVDVSSGVESAPGVKDAARIAAFCAAAKAAFDQPVLEVSL